MNIPNNPQNHEKILIKKLKKSPKTQLLATSFAVSIMATLIFMSPKKIHQAHWEIAFPKEEIDNSDEEKYENEVVFNEKFWKIFNTNSLLEMDFNSENTEQIIEKNFKNSPENQKIFQDFTLKLDKLSPNIHFEEMLFMIFEQESWFNNNARSDMGAFGVAQLTSEVFADMKATHRWIRYHRLIQFLKQENPEIFSFFPEDLALEIEKLSTYTTDEHWENLRKKFYEHRKNPFVNMFLGGMTLSIKHSSIKDEDVENFEKNFLENWEKTGIHFDWVKEFLNNQDFEQKKMIVAAGKYNGSSKDRNVYFHEDKDFDCSKNQAHCHSVVANEKDIYVYKILQKISKNNF